MRLSLGFVCLAVAIALLVFVTGDSHGAPEADRDEEDNAIEFADSQDDPLSSEDYYPDDVNVNVNPEAACKYMASASAFLDCFSTQLSAQGFAANRSSGSRSIITLRRSNGDVIDDVRVEESNPYIQSVRVAIAREDLIARIAPFAEDPQGGYDVHVIINGVEVTLRTTAGQTGNDLTAELRGALRDAGFDAFFGQFFPNEFPGTFLVVVTDPDGNGINKVKIRSEDPAIVSTEVILEPDGRLTL